MGLRPQQVRVLPTDDRWRHGGFAALTAKGRAALAGIERADSVTLDPHKWLFQPMECGSVLIRDGAQLERTFAIRPDYLDGNAAHGDGEVNFADRGLQLSRGFRALKIWVSIVRSGDALVSGTRLAGRHAIRLCVLNPGSTEDDLRRVIEHFADASTPPARPQDSDVANSRADVVADADTGVLRRMPLLSGVPDSTIWAIRARVEQIDVASARTLYAGGIPTGRSTSSCPNAMTSSSTLASSAPWAPVTTLASSLPATGAAAMATPVSQP
jgi:hypothetical protein